MVDGPDLNDDFRDILEALSEAGAEFIVVGAHALAAHGIVRATGDLDILVRPDPPNAQRVAAALRAFGAPLEAHGVSEQDLTQEGTIYQLGIPPRRIDIITRISGIAFGEAWADAKEVRLGELVFLVLGRESLLTNKRATGRPKDIEDVRLLTGEED